MAVPRGGRSSEANSQINNPRGSGENRFPANWQILLFVLAATFLAYAHTLSFDFVHDDFVFLVNNPAIQSWHYLRQYFTASVIEGVYPGAPANYYRPVFLIWARLNDAMFGNQAGLWHLTTVGTHLLATALSYYLALRLLKDRLAAGIAALVFGLHPVHIEAVAWVSGVTEPLVGIFFFGAFLCHLKTRDRGRHAKLWLLLAIVLYIVGILEKETEILLPAIICVYEWLYSEELEERAAGKSVTFRAWRAIRAAEPFLVATIPYLFVRVAALHGFSHPITSLSWKDVVCTWPLLVWFWIRHLVVPIGLGTFYDLRTVEHAGWGNFLSPALAAAVGIGLLLWGAWRSRTIAFSAAWMILPLLPFLDLRMFHQNNFAQDRFLYLPSLGLAIIVGMAFRVPAPGHGKFCGFDSVRAISVLALGFLLGYGTWRQCFYFENNWIFYRYNYLLSPHNAYAANDYGVILERLGMKDEALRVLEQAVADEPDYRSANYNVGRLYYEAGEFQLAKHYLTRSVELDPSFSEGYLSLGMNEMKQGNLQQAEAEFRMAIRWNPRGREYHYQLGLALMAQGKTDGARQEFQRELEVNPTHPRAHELLRESPANTKDNASDVISPH